MHSKNSTKWIVVTGGVISTLGKGIVSSSLGALLKMRGYTVTAAKIDPYINIDAGTMRPTEHGEVFVTCDGGETDQDIGNYERFLDINVPKYHNLTTGQVYREVINRERNLEYEGKCVEVIPHIPLEVQRRLKICANTTKADFVLVEIGGTIGDYQNVLFLEALRTMKLKGEQMIFVHVVYLPTPKTAGEMKSKPAQHSSRELNSVGIQADFIVCRADKEVDDIRKEKLSLFCNVKPEDVISCQDLESIYDVPLLFVSQKFDEKILKKFNIKPKSYGVDFKKWREFINKKNSASKSIKVGIVGKYFASGNFALEDSYISVIEAIKHACYKNSVRPDIFWISSQDFENNKKNIDVLKDCDAIIVPGGFGSSGVEGKINTIKYARENKIPFLGICYGLQLAVIEHARNILGWIDANSTEINKNTKYPVVDILPEQKKKMELKDYGATMRLGDYLAFIQKGSLIYKIYGNKEKVVERHRHRYEVNPELTNALQSKGLIFSGLSPDKKLVEFMERSDHPYFVATQAHPEFTSRVLKPNPLFDGLIIAAINRKNKNKN
ncbi:MAG: CTP synthase [Candidatus Woesearchaeota archaeon]|jgi:CTP synthase